MDKIPRDTGVLLVFYHGVVPLDFWYFGLNLYQDMGRPPCALADRWLFKVPGLRWLTKAVGGINANREQAVGLLRQGYIVGVSPGGVREAIAGAEKDYQLCWGGRIGFARLALEANVPIVAGFTKNVESLYRAPFAGSRFFNQLYEKTRLPLVPILGLGPFPFPVKLTTHLSDPIFPQPGDTPESLAERVKKTIEDLITQNQDPRQTVFNAIKERL